MSAVQSPEDFNREQYRQRIFQLEDRLHQYAKALEEIAQIDIKAHYAATHAVFVAIKALKDNRVPDAE